MAFSKLNKVTGALILVSVISLVELVVIIYFHNKLERHERTSIDLSSISALIGAASTEQAEFFTASNDLDAQQLLDRGVLPFLAQKHYLLGPPGFGSDLFTRPDGSNYSLIVDADRDGSIKLPVTNHQFKVTGPPGLVVVYEIQHIPHDNVVILGLGPLVPK